MILKCWFNVGLKNFVIHEGKVLVMVLKGGHKKE